MTAIEDFIRARLDATEAASIYQRDGHPGLRCTNSISWDPDGQMYDEYDSCARHVEAAKASPYSDAAFGLADVAAKRAILDMATHDAQYPNFEGGWESAIDDVVQHLAQPYADHPDFDPSWRPA